MQRLHRDKRTGVYYSEDGRWEIERGSVGWNLNEIDNYMTRRCGEPIYRYSSSTDTLKEARESI